MKLKGDFFWKLSLYLRCLELDRYPLQERNVFEKFCDLWKCQCLITDDSYNPYSMLLIKGSNQYHTVSMSPDNLDQDIYIIDNRFDNN